MFTPITPLKHGKPAFETVGEWTDRLSLRLSDYFSRHYQTEIWSNLAMTAGRRQLVHYDERVLDVLADIIHDGGSNV